VITAAPQRLTNRSSYYSDPYQAEPGSPGERSHQATGGQKFVEDRSVVLQRRGRCSPRSRVELPQTHLARQDGQSLLGQAGTGIAGGPSSPPDLSVCLKSTIRDP